MIGNDIVDLALAKKESNWKRKGFLDKIFTKKEQLMISNAKNPEVMVWNLWSRKEAAYKISNRKTHIRSYSPLQFECFDLEIFNGNILGKVVINDNIYYTKTEITNQFINTIAAEKFQDLDKIKKLENRKNIKKNNGIPSYFEKDNILSKPISISNHGEFERIITI